jgi:hypothetical protein
LFCREYGLKRLGFFTARIRGEIRIVALFISCLQFSFKMKMWIILTSF